jgi:hypothetical protein
MTLGDAVKRLILTPVFYVQWTDQTERCQIDRTNPSARLLLQRNVKVAGMLDGEGPGVKMFRLRGRSIYW